MLEVDRPAVTIIAYILYSMRRLASQISDMPDVLYYLLYGQQRQDRRYTIGPTRHGCKRKKQDLD